LPARFVCFPAFLVYSDSGANGKLFLGKQERR